MCLQFSDVLLGGFGDVEKDLCGALCQLRNESDAKTVSPSLPPSPPPFSCSWDGFFFHPRVMANELPILLCARFEY